METTPDNSGAGWFAPLVPARDSGARDAPALGALVERIRRRWRWRLLLDGLFRVLALGAVTVVLAAWLLNQFHFSGDALWILRSATVLTLLALVYYCCIAPLRRRVDDSRVALYLEEHEPGLKSIMLSAVDARQPGQQNLSAQLVEQLTRRALDACARVSFGDRVERGRLRRAGGRLGLALLAIAALAAWPPAFLLSGAPALLKVWAGAAEVSPYRIELAPGDIEIAQASDQLISAGIAGFDGGGVLLFTSTDGGASWRQTEMSAGGEAGRFESLLFDVNADTDYYVSGAGQQTPVHRITVAQIPALESIGLRYHFPAYTMLPPETSHGSGDITALRGTRVEVLIEPTIEIPGGALLLADGREIPLRPAEGGNWIGDLTVLQEDSYRVTLQRASGIPVDASPEYRISALDDLFPSVSILSPGRDMKVSMVEEPLLQVRASDDQGIASLELVLSINGEAEQRIPLIEAGHESQRNQVEAEHIVYLEELGLRPGDLISYYASAADRAPDGGSRVATSDIFFYQVRPFSNNYRRSQQAGGGGGAGAQGGQQQGQLSEQQKQFVVATFKMIRDRSQYSDDAYRENLALLTTAQARIRDRVEAIVRRIESRAVVRADERYQVILEELPAAAEAMLEVEKRLPGAEVDEALTQAQVALKHLQRADAQFRDINVSLASNGGGGGGDNGGSQDLANLFQLEMDKLRNQYDTVQYAAQQQAPSEVIDETLEKLRELARRHQQEVERMLRRQGQAQNGDTGGRQLELAEQLEEMARRLERLSRTQPSPQLRQSIARMREAAETMRQAASSEASGEGGVGEARQAAEELRAARKLLDQGRAGQFAEALERSLRRAELAEKKQAAIKQDVAELDSNLGDKLRAQLEQLEQKKQALATELSELEGDLGKLTSSAREEQPRASQPLKQAIQASREHRLHDRIGRTRQMVIQNERRHALDNESKIQQGIGEIRQHIETALQNVGEGDGRQFDRSLEQMRELARELRSLRERSGGRSAGSGAGSGDYRGRAVGGGGGGGLVTPREFDNIAERARELGSDLREQGVEAGDIDPVLDKIDDLASAADGEPASATQQDLALRALMELEFKLRNRQDAPEYPELLISEPTELPDDYRELIADYFRNLSEQ